MRQKHTKEALMAVLVMMLISVSSFVLAGEQLLISDTFTGTPGSSLANQSLDNGLAGIGSATWSNRDKATYTTVSECEFTTPRTLLALGQACDPTKTYRLRSLIKPPVGGDPWAFWAGFRIMSTDNDEWAGSAPGITIRFHCDRGGQVGDNHIWADYWCEGGWWVFADLGAIDPSTDYDGSGYLPAAVEWIGDGSTTNPLTLKVYLNGNFKSEVTIPDVLPAIMQPAYLCGMVIWTTGAPAPSAIFDDFKLEIINAFTRVEDWLLY